MIWKGIHQMKSRINRNCEAASVSCALASWAAYDPSMFLGFKHSRLRRICWFLCYADIWWLYLAATILNIKASCKGKVWRENSHAGVQCPLVEACSTLKQTTVDTGSVACGFITFPTHFKVSVLLILNISFRVSLCLLNIVLLLCFFSLKSSHFFPTTTAWWCPHVES